MRAFAITGALMALLAVVLGAFAAHGLSKVLEPRAIEVFETGVRYQFYHAVGLLLLLPLAAHASLKWLKRAGGCFVVGLVCFSGSLYMLALTGIKWFGPITPLGGLLFIAGWLCLAIGLYQEQDTP